MNINILLYWFSFFSLLSFSQPNKVGKIFLPVGNYERLSVKSNSFGDYLRNFPLKQNDNVVNLYNGQPYWNQQTHYAILDIDVGTRNLQQCADAVMRLRAEYLYKNKEFSKIHFNFTNGQKADFVKYANGYRAKLQHNKIIWQKIAKRSYTHQTFRKYMNLVFAYAGTYSLNKELLPVQKLHEIQLGDVFIESRQPYGHAVIVMDVAINKKTGKKIFLLAQSYMPAQEIHILINPDNQKLSPWFPEDFGDILHTPEWNFKAKHLKEFKE